MINSSIYNGQVIHKRFKPKVHYFKYNVFSLLIDLSELDQLDKKINLFSYNRFNLVSFYDKDHGDRNGTSLIEWVNKNLEKNNTKIKTMFKIIGAAAAAANLLWEFRIAEKKDAKQIKNKKGKVILVKFIATVIFSKSPTNPGAIIETNAGIKISITIVKNNKPKNNKLKISLANLFDCFFPLIISDE